MTTVNDAISNTIIANMKEQLKKEIKIDYDGCIWVKEKFLQAIINRYGLCMIDDPLRCSDVRIAYCKTAWGVMCIYLKANG